MTHGEIILVDFGMPVGSLPAKVRPAVVMQNDLLGAKDLNTVVMIPFTSNLLAADHEPNVLFSKDETGLSKDSVAVIHLIGAVNKFCLGRKISRLSEENYKKLVAAAGTFIGNS
ncbi:MAG: type II toxin-antitoxin system PemK/MazF family toxin [Treponema sp.]|nr:type II toxin-antitoxin system PemK/MazF family toxin [Treponema sp.]